MPMCKMIREKAKIPTLCCKVPTWTLIKFLKHMKKGQEICGKILKIVLKSFMGYVLKFLILRFVETLIIMIIRFSFSVAICHLDRNV